MARIVREVTVEFGQCDPAGIMYFPNYFDVMNGCTDRLLAQALGVRGGDVATVYKIMGTPLKEARCVYHQPSRWGDVLRVDSRVSRLGRSSFDIEHQIRGEDGGLRVEGFETRVWTIASPDTASGLKAEALPLEVRTQLALGSD